MSHLDTLFDFEKPQGGFLLRDKRMVTTQTVIPSEARNLFDAGMRPLDLARGDELVTC